jgi:hypothetical protein
MTEADPNQAPGPAEQPEDKPEPVAEWESEGGAVLAPGIPLTLRGPDGTGPEELDAALKAARAALPEGYHLERD